MPFILNCTVLSVFIVIIKNSILILFSRLKTEAPIKEQKPVSEVNFVLFYTLKIYTLESIIGVVFQKKV